MKYFALKLKHNKQWCTRSWIASEPEKISGSTSQLISDPGPDKILVLNNMFCFWEFVKQKFIFVLINDNISINHIFIHNLFQIKVRYCLI